VVQAEGKGITGKLDSEEVFARSKRQEIPTFV
jgi:hypothetical protein